MIVEKDIFRILDANLNRSREGLRVCEEVARFILESATLSRQIKSARHAISDTAKNIFCGSKALLEARDARGDIGRNFKPRSELRRLSYIDIFTANMQRVKESLRVLEEFFKLVDKKKSIKCCVLRFRVYDIEKRIAKSFESLRNTR